MVRHSLTAGFALAVFSCAAAHAQDCSIESSLKSSQPGAAVELSFRNASSASRRLYWLDPNGERKFIAVVTPGTVLRQPTSAGHAWVVTDDAEKCLHAVTAAAEPATIDVGATQVAQVAPPAPGVAQPIAAPAEAAIVAPPAPQMQGAPMMAQPAPQLQPAPAPAPPAAPMMAAAPPQNVAVRLPQVSPVEQFQLNGAYRFAPREDETKALNSQATGTIEVARVKPEWDSGQWVFEPVAGTPFVRIRNQWKKTVLADVDGKLRATGAPPQANEAHWTFEPVDGTTFVQLRNRETDRFLLAINGAPALADDFRQDQEIQSHWSVNPASRAVAAAAPRNAAYDSALADCRNLGGHWTGSSCRAINMGQPLSCRPGWAWAPDAGECVWAGGGRCPPWQMGAGGACLTDIACRGGRVRMSGRGYPVCDCPIGAVTWGNYPNLACVPSIARVAPYLVPAALGAAGVVILGQQGFIGAPGRPPVGQVFGNTRFGGGGGNNNTGVTVNVPATPTAATPQAPVTVAAPTTPTTVTPPRPVTAAPPRITRDPAPTNRPAVPTAGTPQTPVTTAVPATPATAPTGFQGAVTQTVDPQTGNKGTTVDPKTLTAGTTVDPKTGVTTTISDDVGGRKVVTVTDPKTGDETLKHYDPQGKILSQSVTSVDPKTGVEKYSRFDEDGKLDYFKETSVDPKTGVKKIVGVDPKTGVQTTTNHEKTGEVSVVKRDPKTGTHEIQLYDKDFNIIARPAPLKTTPGTTVTVDPKTGVATETTPDPKTGINAIKETNLKTGTETAYKVDTKVAPPPAPPPLPNVTTPAPATTPAVATANPGTLARPAAVGTPNPTPAVQGGGATPTAVTTPATSPATDTLVKNFNGFDAKTKASVLASCKTTPAEPSCNAILRSQGALTDAQQASINNCKSNPNLTGCDKLLLGSGLAPRTATTPVVAADQLSKLEAARQRLEGGGATPTAVTTPATSPATDTLVKNFNGFDAKTKASVLASCKTTPAEPSCNAILRSQGALSDAQQTSINNCRSNPNLTGCDKLLLGSGLAPRTATTPPVATTPTAGTQTTPATPKAPPTGIGEAWPPTGNKAATTPAAPVLNPAGGAKVATPAAVPATPAVGTKPAIPAVTPTAVQNNPVTGPNQPPKPTLQKEPESRQATTNPTTPAGTIAPPGKPAAATGAAPKPQAPQVQPQRTPPAAKPVQPVQIAKPAPAPQAASPKTVPTAKPVPQAAKPVQAVQTARPAPQVAKPAPQVARPAAAPQATNPAKKCPQGQQRC